MFATNVYTPYISIDMFSIHLCFYEIYLYKILLLLNFIIVV